MLLLLQEAWKWRLYKSEAEAIHQTLQIKHRREKERERKRKILGVCTKFTKSREMKGMLKPPTESPNGDLCACMQRLMYL